MPKLLLEAHRLQKRFGDRLVLDIDHLNLYDGERVGLIGENGAGKSTLLSILAGEIDPDAGDIQRRCPVTVIHQTARAVADGDARMRAAFRAQPERDGLSGGEQTRRRIAAALSENVPLLLADEPTTDLDAQGIAQLTKHLAAHRGALVLVSHDRALLEALCNRILHLEDGRLTDFPGGYAAYQEELRNRRERQQFEYDQYRAERARLKAAAQKKAEWASSVKKAPKRMGNSEARLHTREYTNAVLRQSHERRVLQNRIERLEVKERPRDLPDIRMGLGVRHPVAARTILEARVKALRAGDKPLLANARFELPTGSRTALMGENGCGKTTLMRVLRDAAGPEVEFRGSIRLNPGARLGWFDQDHAQTLDYGRTALENAMADSDLPEADCRTVLARLNLRGDDVFKPTGVLSGGERAKVALAKLLLGDANLLLLDEPTNHLDVFALEALETLLAGYGGTVLFVSHDRAFVGATATRVLCLENGGVRTHEGALADMEAEAARDRGEEARRLEITAMEMRLANLAARMSAPRKGDRPEDLGADYDALAARLREIKRGG